MDIKLFTKTMNLFTNCLIASGFPCFGNQNLLFKINGLLLQIKSYLRFYGIIFKGSLWGIENVDCDKIIKNIFKLSKELYNEMNGEAGSPEFYLKNVLYEFIRGEKNGF